MPPERSVIKLRKMPFEDGDSITSQWIARNRRSYPEARAVLGMTTILPHTQPPVNKSRMSLFFPVGPNTDKSSAD